MKASNAKDVTCGNDQPPQMQTARCKPACFFRESKKRSFTQLHLDAGQAKLTAQSCT